VDQSGFYLLPTVARTYAPIGQTPILREHLSRDHLSVVSGITLERVMDSRREYRLPDGGRGKRKRQSATPPKRWVASRNPSPTA
jgi:hypothetical protein